MVGKPIFNIITSGGTRASFAPDGFNRFTLMELLRPLEQATRLCRMLWLPPFAVQGTYRLSDALLADYAGRYRRLLTTLAETYDFEGIKKVELLNDWVADLIRKEQP